MPNTDPISDLSSETEAVHDALSQLMNELAKGRKSGEEKGWLTLEVVEEKLFQ